MYCEDCGKNDGTFSYCDDCVTKQIEELQAKLTKLRSNSCILEPILASEKLPAFKEYVLLIGIFNEPTIGRLRDVSKMKRHGGEWDLGMFGYYPLHRVKAWCKLPTNAELGF
jgi:hypothetical protein